MKVSTGQRRINSIHIAAVAVLGLLTLRIAGMILGAPAEYPIDFQIFHKVGQLAWEGRIALAYDLPAFSALEAQATGSGPLVASWAYPPQFDLVAAALALLPMWLGYVLFTLGTLALMLAALGRLGPGTAALGVLAVLPALVSNVTSGQNGFLTAALAGWFALAFLRRSPLAGIPLGLLIIKPHLAVGLVLLVLMRRQTGTLAVAAATVALSSALATLAFGPSIWGHTLAGMSGASDLLKDGSFAFFRLTSVYAALTTLGLPYPVAMTAHAAVALLALAAVWLVRDADDRTALGLALIASLLVSPYVYDYDLALLGLALALVLPALALRPPETALVLAAAWTACGWGMAVKFLSGSPVVAAVDPESLAVSLAGPVLALTAAGLVWRALRPPVPALA